MLYVLRWQTRYTQEHLARAMGISQARLSQYENGEVTPSWPVLVRMLAGVGRRPRIVLEEVCEDKQSDLMRAAEILAPLTDGLTWAATGELADQLVRRTGHCRNLSIMLAVPELDMARIRKNLSAAHAMVWDRDFGPVGSGRFRPVYWSTGCRPRSP